MSDYYRDVIANVCEGWNISPDLRKYLETELFNPSRDLSAVPPAKAEGLSDEQAAVNDLLRGFVDYFTEPAGMTPEVVFDKDEFNNFIEENDRRAKDLTDRARAILEQQAKKGNQQ